MFDLPGSDPPSDVPTLRQGLEQAVARRVLLPEGTQPVEIDMPAWPRGRLLSIRLNGGHIDIPTDPAELRRQAKGELKPPAIVSDRAPGPHFEAFSVRGEPVKVGPMACRLILEASDVQFEFGRDEDGTLVMAPAAGDGHLEAAVPKEELMAFVRRQAVEAASEKGVQIQEIDLALASPSARVIEVRGTLHGRKKLAFITAPFVIDLSAVLEVDDQLIGHIRVLDLHGRGVILDTLLSLLRPKLEQIKAQPLPLRDVLGAFIPAAMGLRDFAISIDGDVCLNAQFGASGAAS